MYDKRLIWKFNVLFEKVPGTLYWVYILQILLDKKAFWSGYLKNDLLHANSLWVMTSKYSQAPLKVFTRPIQVTLEKYRDNFQKKL